MNKIITKILIAIILCSLIIAVSIGYLSVEQASKSLRQEAYAKLHYVSSNYANEFSATLKSIEGHVCTLSSVVASSFDSNQFVDNTRYQSDYMKQLDALLKKIGDDNPGIQGVYIMINPELTGQVFESWFINDGQGQFIYQEPEDISVFSSTNEDMAWYYEPINKREGVWVPPYVDATINLKMISYTKAIFNNGLLIGVAGIDLSFDDIEKTIGNMKIYESGYSFLINTDHTILLHPSLEPGTYIPGIKNEDFDNIVTSLEKNKFDVIEYVFKNEEKILGFSKLSNGWVLAVSTIASEILTPVERLKNSIKISVIFLLVITAIIGLFISKSITAPINRLKDMAALISQGQHDIELDLNSNNEIGELSKSFHIMTKQLLQSNKHLKRAQSVGKVGHWEYDPVNDLIYGSDEYYRIFGSTPEKHQDFNDFIGSVHPEDVDHVRAKVDATLKKKEPYITDYRIVLPDFSIKYIHAQAEIEYDHDDIPINMFGSLMDVTELTLALDKVKTLSGLLPICSSCKKIRDDKGYWNQIESFIEKYSSAEFSHGMCPECSDKLYGDEDWYIDMKKKK